MIREEDGHLKGFVANSIKLAVNGCVFCANGNWGFSFLREWLLLCSGLFPHEQNKKGLFHLWVELGL